MNRKLTYPNTGRYHVPKVFQMSPTYPKIPEKLDICRFDLSKSKQWKVFGQFHAKQAVYSIDCIVPSIR